MVPLRLPETPLERPTPQRQNAEDLAFLNHLRFMSMGCRAKARADLFEACALLSMDRASSRDAHSEALVRCLDQALGKRPIMFQPGTEEISFDEAWLVQLGRAIARDDENSVAFLLKSRVPFHLRRHIRHLMTRISESFSVV